MSEELELRINIPKIKVMVIDRAGCLPKSDVLKKYDKVNIFVLLDLTVKVSGGS